MKENGRTLLMEMIKMVKKYAVFGDFPTLEKTTINYDFIDNIVDINPDFVITIGGDGTIVASERKYPGIPKIAIRQSDHGNKCMYKPYDLLKVISSVCAGKYDVIEEPKLYADFNGITLHALNEIQLHNESPLKAIRFTVETGGESLFADEIIGDGIIVATPFGSTGYFKSIVKDLSSFPLFKTEIGVALNNAHNVSVKNDIALKNPEQIILTITRGNALLVADNNPFMMPVTTGDRILVGVDVNTAKFVKVDVKEGE